MTGASILRVALPVPVRRLFDYLAPRGSDGKAIPPGSRVRVPFGARRSLTGIVIGHAPDSEIPRARLKTAGVAMDSEPVLPESHLGFLLQAAAYYQHPVGDALFQCLPTRFRGPDTAAPETEMVFVASPGAAARIGELGRAPRQRTVLQLLLDHPDGLTGADLAARGLDRALANALSGRGLVERRARSAPAGPGVEPDPPIPLNAAQARAVADVEATLGRFAVHLLNGVTGSGKTEVYLAVVAAVLDRGRQAMLLVPEIGLTPQLIARVRQRLGVDLAVLHSGLSDSERARAWLSVRDGHTRVVLGTRSALWTPMAAPGVIIIDEEHDLSYKQQDGFRYSARDMGVARGKAEDIPVILGSATPSLETLRNVRDGRYGELRLPQRTGTAPAPQVSFIDLRGARLTGALSGQLLDALRETAAAGEQSLLFLNRRGYAPVLQCHLCGTVAECHRCNMPYTWHKQRGRLICHHCGGEQRERETCGACGEGPLQHIGHGTERLAETLAGALPGLRILRVDRDSTRARGAMDRVVTAIHAGAADILIGTQMLAKGHHFPGLTLVGIIDADRGLYSTDFRAAERMAQLFVQVSGRAGRGERPGRVLIQTHHPDHPLLCSLVERGYDHFAALALAERSAAMLPPYTFMTLIRAEHARPEPAREFLEQARALLTRPGQDLELYGPLPAPMERRAGRYRFQLVIQARQRRALGRTLGAWLSEIESLPAAGRVRWSVDVDPQDMM